MTPKQMQNLRKAREVILALPPRHSNNFHMNSACQCAWHYIVASGALPPARDWDASSSAADSQQFLFGLDIDERQYLFVRRVAEEYTRYSTPNRAAGIIEFADRVENVIQYYKSLVTA